MSNVVDFNKQIKQNHVNTLNALGVSVWNERAFKLHRAISSSISFVLDPIRAMFDSTPTLSETETKALYAKGGDNMIRLEFDRMRANYRG